SPGRSAAAGRARAGAGRARRPDRAVRAAAAAGARAAAGAVAPAGAWRPFLSHCARRRLHRRAARLAWTSLPMTHRIAFIGLGAIASDVAAGLLADAAQPCQLAAL